MFICILRNLQLHACRNKNNSNASVSFCTCTFAPAKMFTALLWDGVGEVEVHFLPKFAV